MYNNNAIVAGKQLWATDGVGWAGATQITVVSGPRDMPTGGWALVLPSTRTATYSGQSYTRESAPSKCYLSRINGSGQNFQFTVSNVPGAAAYNIYAAPSGSCSGPYGLAATLFVAGTPQNTSTCNCPLFSSGSGCSLGFESIVLDGSQLPAPFAPNALPPPSQPRPHPPPPT